MTTEKNDRENEIILDKIRKLSMCGDQDRITNSNLLDAMATIAEQIALVARMGDEDEVAATSDPDDEMIDDSEHVDTTFVVKADTHHLDGREAFSFDQAFDDDHKTRPFQIGTIFDFMITDEDGVLHLSPESSTKLPHHLEHLNIVGVFDFTLNTSPQSMPLYFSKMISSSKSQNVPELFNISMPPSLTDIEGMVLGLWGPLLHPPNNQLDHSTPSGRVLYLVLKCQSLYQSMNSAAITAPSDPSAVEAETTSLQSQCVLKCATIISLLSQSLIVSTDLPIDRTSSSPSSPLVEIQQQSSQIISTFLVSLSQSCAQLIETNQANEETLRRKVTLPPSLCIIRECNQRLLPALQTSPSLSSLYSSLLASDSKLRFFHSQAIYLQEVCLDQPSTSSPGTAAGAGEVASWVPYDSFAKILNNLLISHLTSQMEMKPPSEENDQEPADQPLLSSWNGPYLIELSQLYLSYVEELYRDRNCAPQGDDESTPSPSTTTTAVPAAAEQDPILQEAMAKYRAIMSQSFSDPTATSPSRSLLLMDERSLAEGISVLPRESLRSHTGSNFQGSSGNIYDAGLETLFAKDFDEVDPNFSQTLQMSHSQACETVLSEFQSRLEEHSLSSAQLTQLFHEESLKYERHGYLRSLRYNELVFKDCLEELTAAHHSSSSGSDGSPSEDMSLKISQPLIFAQVLEVYYRRARGPAKREVVASYLSKYSGSEIKSENEILRGQICQYHATHLKMRSRLEELATENAQLHRTVEEKTDKALDAWAALHEKYSNLERSLSQAQYENKMKDDYINKLRVHITQIEKMNAAMKYGVNKLLEEENLRQAQHPAPVSLQDSNNGHNSRAPPDSAGGSSIFDIVSFALACATGSPLDVDAPVAIDNDSSQRSGFNWQPSVEIAGSNGTSGKPSGSLTSSNLKAKDTE